MFNEVKMRILQTLVILSFFLSTMLFLSQNNKIFRGYVQQSIQQIKSVIIPLKVMSSDRLNGDILDNPSPSEYDEYEKKDTRLETTENKQKKLDEFRTWFAEQTLKMDSLVEQPDKIVADLRKKAQLMSKHEIKYLTQIAQSYDAHFYHRSFAVYLLMQIPEKTSSELKKISAMKARHFEKEVEPHSFAETELNHDLSIKRMAEMGLEGF